MKKGGIIKKRKEISSFLVLFMFYVAQELRKGHNSCHVHNNG